MSKDDMLGFSDVMDRLKIGRKHLTSLITSGKLDAYKVSRVWRFYPSDVDAYLDSVKFTPRARMREQPVRRRSRAADVSAGAGRYA